MNCIGRYAQAAAILAMALCTTGLAAGDVDPVLGMWKLNTARSTFVPSPGPKGQIRTYKFSEGTETLVSRGVAADGKPTLVQYSARYDGKDYPMTGSSGGDRIELRHIDPYTTESIQKRNGVAAITAKRMVSVDGKTLTVVTRGTTAAGESIEATMVFDRL